MTFAQDSVMNLTLCSLELTPDCLATCLNMSAFSTWCASSRVFFLSNRPACERFKCAASSMWPLCSSTMYLLVVMTISWPCSDTTSCPDSHSLTEWWKNVLPLLGAVWTTVLDKRLSILSL